MFFSIIVLPDIYETIFFTKEDQFYFFYIIILQKYLSYIVSRNCMHSDGSYFIYQ